MTISYFLIAAVTPEGRLLNLGTVHNGKRLSVSHRVAPTFPANTRARDTLLRVCRGCLKSSPIPNWVEFEVRNVTYRVIPVL